VIIISCSGEIALLHFQMHNAHLHHSHITSEKQQKASWYRLLHHRRSRPSLLQQDMLLLFERTMQGQEVAAVLRTTRLGRRMSRNAALKYSPRLQRPSWTIGNCHQCKSAKSGYYGVLEYVYHRVLHSFPIRPSLTKPRLTRRPITKRPSHQ
jgi:hypothetical protein